MNTHRVSRIPIRAGVIVALILLSVGGVAMLITAAWPLVFVPSAQGPSQADPWEVVNALHAAINGNNVDELLAMFSDNAEISDNESPIQGGSQIRDWALYSERMAGLHLKMFHSEMHGEKLIWLDKAYTGPEAQNRYFILRWEAVIAQGKIQSLVVTPRYLPDLK
jgi:hypothetical protein